MGFLKQFFASKAICVNCKKSVGLNRYLVGKSGGECIWACSQCAKAAKANGFVSAESETNKKLLTESEQTCSTKQETPVENAEQDAKNELEKARAKAKAKLLKTRGIIGGIAGLTFIFAALFLNFNSVVELIWMIGGILMSVLAFYYLYQAKYGERNAELKKAKQKMPAGSMTQDQKSKQKKWKRILLNEKTIIAFVTVAMILLAVLSEFDSDVMTALYIICFIVFAFCISMFISGRRELRAGKGGKTLAVVTVLSLVLFVVFLVLAVTFGGGSSGSAWDKLTDGEKEWYRNNYGNGQYNNYKDAVNNYKNGK